MARKKGQEMAGNAAGLVIFIGMILIVYLFVLRPDDRNAILGINETEANGGIVDADNITELVIESPGSLFAQEQKSFEHPLSQIVLSSQSEDRVVAEKSSVYVMSSKLDKKDATIRFETTEGIEYEALILSFYVQDSSGKIIITFNGQEIFYGELNRGVNGPLRIDTILIEDTNYLEFSVPKVPWYRFWGRNQYEIRDVKLIASTRNLEAMEALSTFRLSQVEVDEYDHGYLRFTEECKGRQEGILKVYLNGGLISSSITDCYGYEKIDIAAEDIVAGKNEVLFDLSEGTLYLTNIEIKLELKEARYPIYYFELNDTTWERIVEDDLEVYLDLDFIREYEDKEAEFEINRRKFYMDTDELSFSKDIKSYLRQGSNYITLIPKTELNIAQLRVFIEEDE